MGTGYGPGSLSSASSNVTRTFGWFAGTTTYGMPIGPPSQRPEPKSAPRAAVVPTVATIDARLDGLNGAPCHHGPMPDAPRPVEIRDDVIRLGQLLQLAGIVDSGSDAKMILAGGEVQVNGEPEGRRGRQLHEGDVVEVFGERLVIVATAGA